MKIIEFATGGYPLNIDDLAYMQSNDAEIASVIRSIYGLIGFINISCDITYTEGVFNISSGYVLFENYLYRVTAHSILASSIPTGHSLIWRFTTDSDGRSKVTQSAQLIYPYKIRNANVFAAIPQTNDVIAIDTPTTNPVILTGISQISPNRIGIQSTEKQTISELLNGYELIGDNNFYKRNINGDLVIYMKFYNNTGGFPKSIMQIPYPFFDNYSDKPFQITFIDGATGNKFLRQAWLKETGLIEFESIYNYVSGYFSLSAIIPCMNDDSANQDFIITGDNQLLITEN